MRWPTCLALVCATCTLIPSTHADLVIDEANGLVLDVTATAGTGTSTAYFVLDFAYTNGESIALAYNFNGDASAHDAFLAFGDIGLVYTFDDFGGWGLFVNNFAWGDNVGDASNYWAHSLASPDGSGVVHWSDAFSSVDTTPLTDGFLSGWYNGFNDDFSAIPPALPLITVPGPSVLALVGLGLCTSRRRRSLAT
jgi:hypothetical protein